MSKNRVGLLSVLVTFVLSITMSGCIDLEVEEEYYGSDNYFNGTWSGSGSQGSEQSWSIVVDLDRNTISYPSIPCEGYLTPLASYSTRIDFRETITSGVCVNNGKVVLEQDSDNKMTFNWFYQNGTHSAFGYLRKQ